MLTDEQIEKMDLIYKYFHIGGKINHYLRRKQYIEWVFDKRSFCSGTVFDGYDIKTVGIRVEKVVIDKLDALMSLNRLISFNRKREKYFHDYLHQLETETLRGLKNKYKKRCRFEDDTVFTELDQEVFEEIQEIETAVRFEFYPALVEVDPDSELPEMEKLLEMDFNDIMDVMGL